MEAIYAACREMDDLADGPGTAAERSAELDRWEREIHDARKRKPAARPAVAAVAEASRACGVRLEHFDALLAGLRSDLGPVRLRTTAELFRYCDRVAGAVGLLCLPAFGAPEDVGAQYAIDLGRGLQLTNILRDLHSDLSHRRVYFPALELEMFGVPARAWPAEAPAAAVEDLLAFQCARAGAFLRHAEKQFMAFPKEVRGALRPAEAMRRAYGALLKQISVAGREVLARRVSLPRWAAAWAFVRAALPR